MLTGLPRKETENNMCKMFFGSYDLMTQSFPHMASHALTVMNKIKMEKSYVHVPKPHPPMIRADNTPITDQQTPTYDLTYPSPHCGTCYTAIRYARKVFHMYSKSNSNGYTYCTFPSKFRPFPCFHFQMQMTMRGT